MDEVRTPTMRAPRLLPRREWRSAELRKRQLPWSRDEIDIPGGTHAADLDNAYRLGLCKLFGWHAGKAAP